MVWIMSYIFRVYFIMHYSILFYHVSVMTTSTPEKQDGLKALNDAIEVIQDKITSLGGVFNVQMAVNIMNKYVRLICILDEN